MAARERIIPPEIQADGSVRYRSVMTPPDDSVAVCYLVSRRMIPVVFVPGVMGSNLLGLRPRRRFNGEIALTKEPVWLLDSMADAATLIPVGAEFRKIMLDPLTTSVYDGGKLPTGTSLTEREMRRRGWGEVAHISYGGFLAWLENALNDTHDFLTGVRSQLMEPNTVQRVGVQPLTRAEVALSYKYRYPVHAVGYNWLQSNRASAEHLKARVEAFMAYYRKQGFMCDRVILVTHSMGGLVSRCYTEVLGGRDRVLGVVHGVMPATGAPAAYKRVKAGTEKPAGWALGCDAEEMTAVFAQSPGPLQLLPTPEYGMRWLKFRDGDRVIGLPESDPYDEIYIKRGRWWNLCDDKLINPADKKKETLDHDWKTYESLIKEDVKPFHQEIAGRYHPNSYAFFGDDANHKSWGEVTWQRRHQGGLGPARGLPVDDPLDGKVVANKGTGEIAVHTRRGDNTVRTVFQIQPAADSGDGTVPLRSGAAPKGKTKVCLAYRGIEHEAAYKALPIQLFTLWSIVKITDAVKLTSMAYGK